MGARESRAPLRVAQVGTFDVANFGDLLFPLLARAALADRLDDLDLVLYSLGAKSSASGWPFDVRAIDAFPDEVAGFDLVLIGGGDVIRADSWSAPGYEAPASRLHHPTSLWAAASLLAAVAGVPVAWNAPGVVRPFDRAIAPLARASARCATYLAVRDESSRERLTEVDTGLEPHLAPDTAIGIRAAGLGSRSAERDRLLAGIGVRAPYVVVQPSPAMAAFADDIRGVCERLRREGVDLVALPISPVIGDRPDHLAELGLPAPPTWPNPLLLAEILAGAEGFVGVSLHASLVTAVCGGVVLRPSQDGVSKYEILGAFPSVASLGADPRAAERRLREGAPPSTAAAIRGLERSLDRHWDTVAALPGRDPGIDPVAILTELAIEAAEPLAQPAQVPMQLAELKRVVGERDRLSAALETERELRFAAEAELAGARGDLSRRSVRAVLALSHLVRGDSTPQG